MLLCVDVLRPRLALSSAGRPSGLTRLGSALAALVLTVSFAARAATQSSLRPPRSLPPQCLPVPSSNAPIRRRAPRHRAGAGRIRSPARRRGRHRPHHSRRRTARPQRPPGAPVGLPRQAAAGELHLHRLLSGLPGANARPVRGRERPGPHARRTPVQRRQHRLQPALRFTRRDAIVRASASHRTPQLGIPEPRRVTASTHSRAPSVSASSPRRPASTTCSASPSSTPTAASTPRSMATACAPTNWVRRCANCC